MVWEEAAGCSKLRRETESRQLLAQKRELKRELRAGSEGERALVTRKSIWSIPTRTERLVTEKYLESQREVSIFYILGAQ